MKPLTRIVLILVLLGIAAMISMEINHRWSSSMFNNEAAVVFGNPFIDYLREDSLIDALICCAAGGPNLHS